MANGAGSVPEKLRPGSGLPQKQAVRSAYFCVLGMRKRVGLTSQANHEAVMPFRRSCRRARGEWRRLGDRKASPRVGPPTKAGRAQRPTFACLACANQRRRSRRHDGNTLLVGAVSTANKLGPPSIERPDLAQSFTPTEPRALSPAPMAGTSRFRRSAPSRRHE